MINPLLIKTVTKHKQYEHSDAKIKTDPCTRISFMYYDASINTAVGKKIDIRPYF